MKLLHRNILKNRDSERNVKRMKKILYEQTSFKKKLVLKWSVDMTVGQS